MELTIRPLKSGDTRALLAFANSLIEEDTFVLLSGKPLTLAHESRYVSEALSFIKKKEKIHLVAEVSGVIAGSGEIRRGKLRRHHVGEIGISVLKEFRRKGIGRRLMSELIAGGNRMGLRVLMLHCFENNTAALALYKKFGFIECGLLPEAFLYRGGYVGEVTLYKMI